MDYSVEVDESEDGAKKEEKKAWSFKKVSLGLNCWRQQSVH